MGRRGREVLFTVDRSDDPDDDRDGGAVAGVTGLCGPGLIENLLAGNGSGRSRLRHHRISIERTGADASDRPPVVVVAAMWPRVHKAGCQRLDWCRMGMQPCERLVDGAIPREAWSAVDWRSA